MKFVIRDRENEQSLEDKYQCRYENGEHSLDNICRAENVTYSDIQRVSQDGNAKPLRWDKFGNGGAAPALRVPQKRSEGSPTTGEHLGNAIRWRRIGKISFAVLAVTIVAIAPMIRLATPESAQAIVNARVATVRAPIDGVVRWGGGFHIGSTVSSGEAMMIIENLTADSTALDNLRRELFRLQFDRNTLADRISTAEEERKSLLAANELHRSARIEQYEQRKQQILAQISVAKANEVNAESNLKRSSWLAERGLVTRALLEEKSRESEIARQSVAMREHQLNEIQIELTAALQGIRLTDDHNAQSHMSIRAEALLFEVRTWQLQLEKQDQLIAKLTADKELEEQRLNRKEKRAIASPSDGPIWEIIAASGELVLRGQPLVRVMNCINTVISASVSEATYNKLKVGDTATFRSSSDLTEYQGYVAILHGLAAPPANLAIQPANLQNEAFRVIINLPNLPERAQCSVGQTGIVKFHVSGSSEIVKRIRYWIDYWFA